MSSRALSGLAMPQTAYRGRESIDRSGWRADWPFGPMPPKGAVLPTCLDGASPQRNHATGLMGPEAECAKHTSIERNPRPRELGIPSVFSVREAHFHTATSMQSGPVERLNARMRHGALRRSFPSLAHSWAEIASRVEDHNRERPHSAMGHASPVSSAANPDRRWPASLRPTGSAMPSIGSAALAGRHRLARREVPSMASTSGCDDQLAE